MRILHLLSNWKWTERSEPSVDLAFAQQKNAEVYFACDTAPEPSDSDVFHMAKAKGLQNVSALNMPKHLNMFSLPKHVSALRKFLDDCQPDIVHCHMPNAHLLAGMARRDSSSMMIVRSSYEPDNLENNLRENHLYRNKTDGVIVVSDAAKQQAIDKYNISADRIIVAEPGIDLNRFNSGVDKIASRKGFGLGESDFVVGIVSRIRDTRRLDVPLDTVADLVSDYPELKLLVIGRGSGTAVNDIIHNPAAAKGITDNVYVPGYCVGDRLVEAYRAMDVLVYPVPGTDKSCRTVRESLAAGTPVIAPRTGFLSSLIIDSVNGMNMELSARSLSLVLRKILDDKSCVAKMSEHALDIARERFDRNIQAEQTLAFYRTLLGESA